ncbi:MAG TPA: hypothetical protein VHA14_20885 [Bryobacteraceae bacterium]|nr:hypothetical protein [Bryobacteraceae bacterium]
MPASAHALNASTYAKYRQYSERSKRRQNQRKFDDPAKFVEN